MGHPPPTLAVSEHTALRSSDFPLPRPCQPRRAGRQGEAAITRLARATFMIVSLPGRVKSGAGFGCLMLWTVLPPGLYRLRENAPMLSS